MNTKHTPGPWKVSTTYKDAQAGKFSIAPWASQRQSICRLSAREDYPAEYAEANARLIAAAPDLLAACEELLDGMVKGEKHNTANVTLYAIGMIREAIRKAGGQQ